MKRVFLAAAALAAVALAACNNGYSTPFAGPTPGPTCAPPAGMQYALVYPAPSSTAIPDNISQVIVGSSAAFPSTWDVTVVTVNTAYPGGLGGAFQPASPPFPTPNATPSFSNPVYQSSSLSGLGVFGSQEVVNVYLNDLGANCSPLGPIGSFTTM